MKQNPKSPNNQVTKVKTQPNSDQHSFCDDSFDLKTFLDQQEVRPESVVQTMDTRKGVINTNNWPFCAIGEIQSVFEKNGVQSQTKGTITMVGPKIGITAAHNVYSHLFGEAIVSIVTLGRNGSYHIAKCKIKKPFIFPSLYKQLPFNERIEHDYAFVVLDVNDLQEFAGFVGMKSNFLPKSQAIGLFGYPQDKYLYNFYGEVVSYLWGDTGSIKMLPKSKNTFMYNISTFAGQSGAALLCLQGDQTRIVGIHTNGGRRLNFGVRLTNQILKQSRDELWRLHKISLY